MTEIIDSTEDIFDPIKDLLLNRKDPTHVTHQETVRDALVKMVDKDFSQLPVVDNEGFLTGIISEQTISRQYFHLNNAVSLLDLTVDHCQEDAVTLEREDAGLFEILELLKNNYAVIITSSRRPVGIITDYDTTHFFRDWSEGLIRIQNIELTLRQYIENIFPDGESRNAASLRVLGADRKDPTQPLKRYNELSFRDHIQILTYEHYWERFEPYLKPKLLFINLMEPVNLARNQLAHFRGRLDAIQLDALIRAEQWIASRKRVLQKPGQTQIIREVVPAYSTTPGKYGPLQDWLSSQSTFVALGNEIQVSFHELESIIESPFPDTARKHRAWWANDYTSPHRHSLFWLRAGWKVENVDLTAETVTFKRSDAVLQQLFLVEIIQELKKIRPGITRTTKAQSGWIDFGAGRSGFLFAWVFGKGNLRTELYIDSGDKKANEKAFDLLYQQKNQIESEIDLELDWQPLKSKRASRICVEHPGNANMSETELKVLQEWAIETMLKFVDAFQYRIKELDLD
ncbi:MAG: CBS domain-containing protein [Anaerolineae bacterium]|nr:CBS domain-containing protein [Anaerolineae bacterium]